MCDWSVGPKAAYKLGELSQLSGISRHALKRMLLRERVPLIENGARPLVPLTGFRAAFPHLWDSIVERLALAHMISH